MPGETPRPVSHSEERLYPLPRHLQQQALSCGGNRRQRIHLCEDRNRHTAIHTQTHRRGSVLELRAAPLHRPARQCADHRPYRLLGLHRSATAPPVKESEGNTRRVFQPDSRHRPLCPGGSEGHRVRRLRTVRQTRERQPAAVVRDNRTRRVLEMQVAAEDRHPRRSKRDRHTGIPWLPVADRCL